MRPDERSRPPLPQHSQPGNSQEWLAEISKITKTDPREALKVAVKRLEGPDLMLALGDIEATARDQAEILPLDNYKLVPEGPNRDYWIERLARDSARKDLKTFANWMQSLNREYQAHAADEAIQAISVRQERVGLEISKEDLLSHFEKIANALSDKEEKAAFVSKATPVLEKQGVDAGGINSWMNRMK